MEVSKTSICPPCCNFQSIQYPVNCQRRTWSRPCPDPEHTVPIANTQNWTSDIYLDNKTTRYTQLLLRNILLFRQRKLLRYFWKPRSESAGSEIHLKKSLVTNAVGRGCSDLKSKWRLVLHWCKSVTHRLRVSLWVGRVLVATSLALAQTECDNVQPGILLKLLYELLLFVFFVFMLPNEFYKYNRDLYI